MSIPPKGKQRHSKKKTPEVMQKIREIAHRTPRPALRDIAEEISTPEIKYTHTTVRNYAREMGIDL